MTNLLIYIFLISIWNSVLFYEKQLGVSVVLFIVPLIVLLYYSLKKKIKNKKGLLFSIPIILLSLTYMIYDNKTFNAFNFLSIPLLFILMFIYCIKPNYNIKSIINDIFIILLKPINRISKIYNLVSNSISNKLKLTKESKSKIKSVLIVTPIIILVLYLLASADLMFLKIFQVFSKWFNNINLADILGNVLGRTIIIIILFTYLATTINYLLFAYEKEETIKKGKKFTVNNHSIKLLLTSLNIIYIVFDIIQIRSLLFHKVSMDITYAEYARQGFFQLMIVSIINISIILFSKKHSDNKNTKYNNYMSITMLFLTLIIIISSFLRMYMYECAYGYTLLRLLVYISLITEVILIIPTIIYVISNKYNIIKSYLIIIVTMYVITNLIPMNYVIARKNINRYYESEKIDLDYLMNYNTDNIPLLVELYNKTLDDNIKASLNLYFKRISYKTHGFQEYNISKEIAKKSLK